MKEELVRTLGKEKQNKFNDNLDFMLDKYKQKAFKMGYNGELRFKKEKGNVIVMVVINP